MQSTPTHTNRDLFFVLLDLSQRFPQFLAEVDPITQCPAAQQIVAVQTYYKKENDVGILCLRFALNGLELTEYKKLIDLATAGGIPVIDSKQLPEKDRELFYQEYLASFYVRYQSKSNLGHALAGLGTRLGFLSPDKSTSSFKQEAKSVQQSKPKKAPKKAPKAHTKLISQLVEIAIDSQLELESKQISSDSTSLKRESHASSFKQAKGKSNKGQASKSHRLPTVPGRPNQERRIPKASSSPTPSGKLSSPAFTPKPLRKDADPDNQLPLEAEVQFQRGDRWKIARLRNLKVKEVVLAASSAPPIGSAVRIWITLGDHKAILTGLVNEVTNTEKSDDGTTSFRVLFGEKSESEHRQLVALLRLARKKGLSLKPPPARTNRRFSLEWPMEIGSGRQRFKATALDISKCGFFLATSNTLEDKNLHFSFLLDSQGSVIEGKANAVRAMNKEEALKRRIRCGYGLKIEPLSQEDQALFTRFLRHVSRRAQKHVLVAGSGQHTQEMAHNFQAAGYVVSRESSVQSMFNRSQFKDCPPDIAVLDQDALNKGLCQEFEDAFQQYSVPILKLHHQIPSLARQRLDRMISVLY